MSASHVYTVMPSPLGDLMLVSQDNHLCGVWMTPHPEVKKLDWRRDDTELAEARAQLDEYFAGTRTKFELELAADGTLFQKKVWKALRTIPFGTTQSYGQLATKIGKPTAARAVGAANGCNPISIVVPCHRVIGADGSLTGFGGGLKRKQWLLNHEAEIVQKQSTR